MKFCLDLGAPYVTPNSLGLNDYELSPLLLLAQAHRNQCRGFNGYFNISDKIALLLRRGADVSFRCPDGNTCLHTVLQYGAQVPKVHCFEKETARFAHSRLEDVLILLVTAGADVCAVNDNEESVSDIAIRNNHLEVWCKVLRVCGYHICEVLHGKDLVGGYSSSVDKSPIADATPNWSKLSFADYLIMRDEMRASFSYPENDDEVSLAPIL